MKDELDIYLVYCPQCEWFGMSDECRYNKCPDCGERVKRDKRKVDDVQN